MHVKVNVKMFFMFSKYFLLNYLKLNDKLQIQVNEQGTFESNYF